MSVYGNIVTYVHVLYNVRYARLLLIHVSSCKNITGERILQTISIQQCPGPGDLRTFS